MREERVHEAGGLVGGSGCHHVVGVVCHVRVHGWVVGVMCRVCVAAIWCLVFLLYPWHLQVVHPERYLVLDGDEGGRGLVQEGEGVRFREV